MNTKIVKCVAIGNTHQLNAEQLIGNICQHFYRVVANSRQRATKIKSYRLALSRGNLSREDFFRLQRFVRSGDRFDHQFNQRFDQKTST